jgi:DNA-binding beta-propeller fold protein YncE
MDQWNNCVKKVDLENFTTAGVTVLAGSTNGYEDGTGVAASFSSPARAVLDSRDKFLYVTDQNGHTVRTIEIATGKVRTIAGKNPGSTGNADGIGHTAAEFNGPSGITFDENGDLYVAERYGNRIRKLTRNWP